MLFVLVQAPSYAKLWAALNEEDTTAHDDENVELEFIDLVPLRFLCWVLLAACMFLATPASLKSPRYTDEGTFSFMRKYMQSHD